jgi:hypothetical protein
MEDEWFDATSIEDRDRGWTVQTSTSGRWRHKRFSGGPWLRGSPPNPPSGAQEEDVVLRAAEIQE